MADPTIIGVNYFDHQFLRRADFDRARDYPVERQQQHARLLHLPGVIDGLGVTASAAGEVKVAPGRAVDGAGHEVVLQNASNQPVQLRVQTGGSEFREGTGDVTSDGLTLDLAAYPASRTEAFLTLCRGVHEFEPSTDVGLTGFTRFVERAVVEVRFLPPDPGSERLLLATLRRAGVGQPFTGVDEAGLLAGAVLADRSVTSAKLAEADGTTAQDTSKGSGVKTAHLQDAAVVTPKLADASVTTDKLADQNVTTAKLADLGVITGKLAAGAVTTAKLDAAAVTTPKIADASVTTDKIADQNVTTAKLAAGAVTTARLDSAAVTTPKIADANVTTDKIADQNVTTAKLADLNVTTAKLAAGAVTTAKLDSAAVTTPKIADANVTTAKLADQNVTTDKIADLNVTTGKLAAGAVTTSKLDTKAVTTAKLDDGAVTGDKIAAGTITADKLDPGVVVGVADGAVTSIKIAEADGRTGQDIKEGNGVKTPHLQDGAVTHPKVARGTVSVRQMASELVASGLVTVRPGEHVVVPPIPVNAGFILPNIYIDEVIGFVARAVAHPEVRITWNEEYVTIYGSTPADPWGDFGRQWRVANLSEFYINVGYRFYRIEEVNAPRGDGGIIVF